jgi:ABC-type iron transport system FetAB permease component
MRLRDKFIPHIHEAFVNIHVALAVNVPMLCLVKILNSPQEPINSKVVPLVGLILGKPPAEMI